MFNHTIEESQMIQHRYHERADAWRQLRSMDHRKGIKEIILIKTADLLIHSGTQLKKRLQPA